jgi:hypothetical protein
MSRNTQYLILVAGEQVDSKSKKDRAIAVAEGLRAENPEATIEVQTGSGNVVHTVKVKGTHAKPWTRTETHEGMEIEVPAGYVVSYTRKRVGAVVARSEAKDGLLVLTESGDRFEVANTKEAREVTNDLAAKHREARETDKQADKQARAEAMVKREQDRAEAKAAKEAEKARKAQEKADAKAAKEAAAAEAEATTDEPAEATA